MENIQMLTNSKDFLWYIGVNLINHLIYREYQH